MIRGVLKLCVLVWHRLQSIRYRILLQIQVCLSGGRANIDPTVRFNTRVRFQGKGELRIGAHVQLGCRVANAQGMPILLQPRMKDATITIGRGATLINGVEIISCVSVCIGADCPIGARAVILDSDFHELTPDQRKNAGVSRPVVIEDNVWIGTDAIVLKGVVIGKDAVIGAGAVVTKNVPAGAIAAGNPARIIGSAYGH